MDQCQGVADCEAAISPAPDTPARGEQEVSGIHDARCQVTIASALKSQEVSSPTTADGLEMQERFYSQHTSSKSLLSVRRHGNCIIAELLLVRLILHIGLSWAVSAQLQGLQTRSSCLFEMIWRGDSASTKT